MNRISILLAAAIAAGPAQAAQIMTGRVSGAVSPVAVIPQYAAIGASANMALGLPQLGSSLKAVSPSVALSAPSVIPQSGLPALPAAAPSVQAAVSVAPQAAPSVQAPAAGRLLPAAQPLSGSGQGLSQLSASMAPDLQALQAAELQGESARGIGERIMSPILGRSQGFDSVTADPAGGSAPAAGGLSRTPGSRLAPSSRARQAPLLSNLGFSETVSAEHQSLLLETLSRRKAGWTRGLSAAGIKLAGPVAPVLSVRSSRAISQGTKVEFTVEWTQGPTHVGAFRAVIALKNLEPEVRRLAEPQPPKESQLRIRFKKTTVTDAGGVVTEVTITDEEISRFLEKKGLRVLTKGWDGFYGVSVTGNAQADAVARELSGQDMVLFATPATWTVPETSQLRLVFKKTTVRQVGKAMVETQVSEDEVGALLRQQGLRVLSLGRDGVYVVGAEGLSPAAAARRLQKQAGVLYASPVKFDAPWTKTLILKLRTSVVVRGVESAVSEDDAAGLFKRYGLLVVADLGGGTYKVARLSDDASAKEAAAALAQEPAVESAVALGGLTDERIRSAARGVAAHKGRPWSSTEYNMSYGMTYDSLERAGATPEQLQLFEKLCAEAPIIGGSFNPWSGD